MVGRFALTSSRNFVANALPTQPLMVARLLIRRAGGGRNPNVSSPGSNQLAGGVLLDGMPNPADAAADGKEHQRRPGGEFQDAGDCRQPEVDVRPIAGRRGGGGG